MRILLVREGAFWLGWLYPPVVAWSFLPNCIAEEALGVLAAAVSRESSETRGAGRPVNEKEGPPLPRNEGWSDRAADVKTRGLGPRAEGAVR